MNSLQKHSLQLAAGAAALGALVMITPRAAHAVAAALVQVTNTAANPAVTQDSSRAASQIIHLTTSEQMPLIVGQMTPMIQIQLSLTKGTPFINGLVPYVVPAGENLVITDVDINSLTANNLIEIFGVGETSTAGIAGYAMNVGSQQYHYASGIVFPSGVSVSLTDFYGQAQVDVWGYLTAN